MADLLRDLDEEQRAAAMAVNGPVCIIAGAGTGKTRTVTVRLEYGIASGQIDPRSALAITHSKKAAAELSGRLHGLGVGAVDARTFHAAGLRVARQFWERTGRREASPQVLAEGESWGLWRASLRSETGTDPDNALVRDLVDEVGWARSRLVRGDGYAAAAISAGRHPELNANLVSKCWDRYERNKARAGKVDFADLLDIASDLVRGDDEVGSKVRRRWSHVTVDEYQDTDPAQQRLLDAILGEGRDICVVGDPRQAIYAWKGADPGYLTGFRERYPEARVFDLSRNYRSSPQILGWANSVAASRGTKPLTATRPAGQRPRVHCLDSEMAEAAWVAGAARKAIANGTPASEIAVLYRFNATQARFEAALARLEIPTLVADDVTFFEREEVRSVMTQFGQITRAQPDRNGMELLTEILDRAGFARDSPPSGLGAVRARWESHLALLELIEAIPGAPERDASSVLAEVNGLARRTAATGTGGVTLATLHRAKGLEWDVVFIVGVTDGAIPSTYADTPEELAEEERLLHVGVTRARRELHLTWAAQNGRGWANKPSPFIDQLPLSPVATVGKSTGKTRTGRVRPAAPKREQETVGSSCAHCASALKGPAARRLGVCAECARIAPGDLGRRARMLVQIAAQAAEDSGLDERKILSPAGMLRLLDQRPDSGAAVSATIGVGLTGKWAAKVAEVLMQ